METIAPEKEKDGAVNIFGEIAAELEEDRKIPPSYHPTFKKRAEFDFGVALGKFRADCQCSRCWSDRFNAVMTGEETPFNYDYFHEDCRVCRVFRARLEEKERCEDL